MGNDDIIGGDGTGGFSAFKLAEKMPVTLVATRPDAEIAADLKKRAIEAYEAVLTLCNEADAEGFELRIGSGKGPLGKHVITQLQVVKVF